MVVGLWVTKVWEFETFCPPNDPVIQVRNEFGLRWLGPGDVKLLNAEFSYGAMSVVLHLQQVVMTFLLFKIACSTLILFFEEWFVYVCMEGVCKLKSI